LLAPLGFLMALIGKLLNQSFKTSFIKSYFFVKFSN